MRTFSQYRRFRGSLSSLLCEDSLRVIWAYGRFLEGREFSMPDDIEVSNKFHDLDHKGKWLTLWDLEVLAKEIIINVGEIGYGGRTFRSWDTFAGEGSSLCFR